MFLELSRDKIMIDLELSREKIMTNSTPCSPSFLDPTLSLIISNFHFWYHNHWSYNYLVILVTSTQHTLTQNLACFLEVGQEAQCTICKFHEIQDFYGQGSTYKNAFQALECYSPTSSQVRVLVIQASIAAYLTRIAVNFFSYDSLNSRKQRNDNRQTTYEDNFSRVLK